ncbi:MAG: histidinol-phosphate aminotransferase family protein [Saprospirales bacterium]|nr:histidinol-phosphate aminotransferase family protein [Saprospirales bacterium]MBK8923891.1 histidinol-phosphate aminotransferase family protein [Saprospirales bacterium]
MTTPFFSNFLQDIPTRVLPTQRTSHLLLDKNEQSEDVDLSIKMQITDSLLAADWNRYPSADNSDIEARVANYCGLNPEHIALGPGSASIITTLLNYFALNNKHIVIAQPTYTLFDYHCKTYNIPYDPWHLTADLEYDYENMPSLGTGSVLVITTPNNPVGNTFSREKLEQTLSDNPSSLVLLDAVYAEFAEADFTPLVRKYSNLIVLRSFSKAFPIAGLRLGYLCAAPRTAAIVRKLMLQFSINHLTQVFAREVLFTPEFLADSRQRVRQMVEERERMFRLLSRRFDGGVMKVFPSSGNFLLVRIFEDTGFGRLMADLKANGINVLNTAPFPLLHNTFRVSVGTPEENDRFLRCLLESLGQQSLSGQPKLRPFSRYEHIGGITQYLQNGYN